MVDLELYKIFKIVADEENLTKASEILHISQPAVTKHIRNLESQLQVQLFTRSKYGMILNENGKKLYKQIKNPIDILIKSEDMFNTNGSIDLGVHVNMPRKIYGKAIEKYYKENEENIVNITALTATNMFSLLEDQKIDIAFSKKYSEEIYDSNNIKFIKLGELHDVFIVNANSKYLKKKMTRKDLRSVPIYTLRKFSSAYQNLAKALGYEPNDETNIENINYTAMIELLQVRDVITVITKEYVEKKIADNELRVLETDLNLPNADYGIYYNVNNKSAKIRNIINIFKNGTEV